MAHESTNTRRHVKLYVLNENRAWDGNGATQIYYYLLLLSSLLLLIDCLINNVVVAGPRWQVRAQTRAVV